LLMLKPNFADLPINCNSLGYGRPKFRRHIKF
jgi:hypothetical protein